MPIKKSAIKHLRQTKKRTLRNLKVKQELKQFIKSTRKAIVSKDKAKITEYAAKLQHVIDKAAHKKIIKPNNAARKKSRLMKHIHEVLKI